MSRMQRCSARFVRFSPGRRPSDGARRHSLASFQAIAAISQAILGLLADARPKPEFAGAQFELVQVSDFQKGRPLQEGISLFLNRVTVSPMPERCSGPQAPMVSATCPRCPWTCIT